MPPEEQSGWRPPEDQSPQPPRNNPQGTVYGGAYGAPTSANSDAPLHETGSFAGHILAQGMPAVIPPTESRSRTRKTVIVLAAGVGLVILAGVFVVVLFASFSRS